MSLTSRIAHNTLIQLISKILSTGIGILVVGMLTRYLGAEGYGHYSTVIAFLQVFSIVLDLGLYIIFVKKISEPGADVDRLTSNVFTIRLLSAVFFLGLAPLIALFFPYPGIVKIGIAITSISYLCITLNQVLTGLFQKRLRMDHVAIAENIGRFVLLGGILLVIALKLSLLNVLGVVVLGSVANFLYLLIMTRRYVKLKLAFDWPIWRNILQASWPIGVSVAFNLVYFKADTVILSLYHSAADVGVYGATYKVLEVMVTLPAMFAGLVMPVLTAAYAMRDMERFRRVQQRAFDFLLMLGLPIVGATLFVATPLMRFVTGAGFDAAGNVLRILILATGVIFVGTLFGNAIVAVNLQKRMIWGYVFVAVVSLTGYFLFIPQYGYYGAAWVTVLSEFLITTISFALVYRRTRQGLNFKFAIKAIIATLIMMSAIWLTRDLPWYLLLVGGTAVYVLSLLAFRAITKEEVKEIIRLRS
ncbi:MAG: flippase [Patescibacteria group bacterium]|jgi:O-antigen/teichoic acid export membrane protein